MPRFANPVPAPPQKRAAAPAEPQRQRPPRQPALAQTLQLRAAASARAASGAAGGSGLPVGLKTGVESLSGLAMDDVRVHRNSAQPAKLGAHAYAKGSDIHLGPGQERHLPHEAWHIVQQKQGRVRATLQMRGVGVNDDGALEREADRMGAIASAGRAAPPAPLRSVAMGGGAPVQAVWVYRAGLWVDEEPYVPQQGDLFEEDFAYQPHVLVDEGTAELSFDKTGKSSLRKRAPPPTHEILQKEREAQGKEVRKRLADDSASIDLQTKQLSDLAAKLEKKAGKSVPGNHPAKVRKLHDTGEVTGPKFRAIIKAQDEFTQSESSSAYQKGLRTQRGSTPPPVRKKIGAYTEQTLRVQSSLRAPTETIVAPVTHKGKMTGQQHPTKRSQPKLEGGSSGHSFADRARVEEQNRLFNQLKANPKASANALFLPTTFKAIQSTVATMSAPTKASNLPAFNKPRVDAQVKERDVIKEMGVIVGEEIGLEFGSAKQPTTSDWRSVDAPMSPLREDPPPVPTTTPMNVQPTTTAPVKLPLQNVVDAAAAVRDTAADLLAAIPNAPNTLGATARNALALRIGNVRDAALLVDLTDPSNEAELRRMLGTLYGLFLSFRNVIRRPTTQNSGGNATGGGGERIAALRQFFAECAQMAARNALILQAFPNLATQQAQQAILDEAALGGLGGFQNQLDENQIRNMLAQPAIPVIGNMAQAATILGHVVANRQQALNQLLISQTERQGAQAIANFINGTTQSLVMVLNTEAHLNLASGYHWISVRITRRPNAQLAIEYLDSLDQAIDYTTLFTAVRQFLAQLPAQPQPQQQPVQGSSQQSLSGQQTGTSGTTG